LPNYNLQNLNIYTRFPPIIVTFTKKKPLQIFCAINKCDSDFKEWHSFTKMDGYQKLCDTNKNMTKMGLIIKGVYYTLYQNQGGYTISGLNFEA
jgi:hypothetical protein